MHPAGAACPSWQHQLTRMVFSAGARKGLGAAPELGLVLGLMDVRTCLKEPTHLLKHVLQGLHLCLDGDHKQKCHQNVALVLEIQHNSKKVL